MKISIKNKSLPLPQSPPSEAAGAILDIAERLAQTRGYNGFSYADIAAELGVTKASLHYHFPSKESLGSALIERYEAVFGSALESIDQTGCKPQEKMQLYVNLYESVIQNDRMCLCGMLAAEFATLPAPMQAELKRFFDMNERWLTTVLRQGRQTGSFLFKESANERARLILGALEGAMLVARSYGDPRRFRAASEHMLEDLGVRKKPRRTTRVQRKT